MHKKVIYRDLWYLKKISKANTLLEEAWNDVKRPGLAYAKWRYKTRLIIAMAKYYRVSGEWETTLAMSNKALQLSRRTGARKHQVLALQEKAKGFSRARHTVKSLEQALILAKKMKRPQLINQLEQDLSLQEQ